MKPKLCVAEPTDFNPEVRAYLEQHGTVDLRACTQQQLPTVFEDYDAVFVRLGLRVGIDELGPSPRCRILAVPATGLDHIDETACAERGVSVISLRGDREFLRQIRATAELTVGLTLALLRRIPQAASHAADGSWRRDEFRGQEIFGRTVGVVGLGRLGCIVADYFRALGAEMLGHEISGRYPDSVEPKPDIPSLIRRSDIVTIHVDYTDRTHDLLDRELLAHFDPQTWLVNTSRGGVVNEEALLDALASGRIAGAALDVVRNEHRWGRDNPLAEYARSRDNLLLVPHIGGNTYQSLEKVEWHIARQVIERLSAHV